MSGWQVAFLFAMMLAFVVVEVVTRRWARLGATPDDARLDVASLLALIIAQPTIVLFTGILCGRFLPSWAGALASAPVLAKVAFLLIGDDMTQYWWHRVSHSHLLWPLHRAHHTAHYMSARMTYRNNVIYYLLMPGLWISGVLVHLGLGPVYVAYAAVKITVIVGAHSAVRWDEPLYRIPALRPVMWLVERTISTPATHWAHHALTNDDGIGHYTGNFGNLLFLWDIIFRTAHITRRYPDAVGLPDDRLFGKERWYVELFFPLVRSRRIHSTLVPGARAYDTQSGTTRPKRAT
jgi:sterol desaturase/sphingolipid hydroxylase (fatty acid hydroxylase superfamily)